MGELTILVGHDMLISPLTNGAVDVRHDSRPSVSQLGRRILMLVVMLRTRVVEFITGILVLC